jgi:hypothetical protein
MIDGVHQLVEESSTPNPNQPVESSVFTPERLFPNPLTWTWSVTRGADLMWVPIPFERSFQMAYSRTRYGTGYYIWHQFVRGANLSRPIQSWDAKTPPDQDVLDLLKKSGSDLVPDVGAGGTGSSGFVHAIPSIDLPKGQAIVLAELTSGPTLLRALELSVPRTNAVPFGKARIRITWDNRPEPSVDGPVALFFGSGTLYNRDGREFLVKAFPMNIRDDGNRLHLACYFPMPFFRSAKIELIGNGAVDIPGVSARLRGQACADPPNHVGYFHATYHDHAAPVPGQDLVLLDTRQTEGGGDWSGSFVGTSLIFSDRAVLNTLEGDPRFFFDDSQTPQAYGTGTEEWSGGGDYWGGRNMTLPLAGHPTGARTAAEAKEPEDQIESAYRYLLADLMPFGRNALIRLEHGGLNESTEHYRTLAYWYGLPAASLVKSDELQIGDLASEQSHRYVSPQASEPYQIFSRYEWGVDTLRGKEIYPPHTDHGRKTIGTSEFNLRLRPDNFGVLLRRKLDYSFPNQRAEVFIAAVTDPSAPVRATDWKPAGAWYLAGANTCVYSDPKGELGATQHRVETSNRRFRDDEFLVPRDLTEGHSDIRVRISFTPVRTPLFPGHPVAELAWSELHYTAYCWVMPNFQAPPATSGRGH